MASSQLPGAPSNLSIGGLLAKKTYAHSGTYSIASDTEADVDATNLAVTFTAPPSGNVMVRLEGLANVSASTAYMWWSVREGAAAVAGPYKVTGNANTQMVTATFFISGISAGSHTYKWGWRRDGGITGSIYSQASFNAPPALMEVWAVDQAQLSTQIGTSVLARFTVAADITRVQNASVASFSTPFKVSITPPTGWFVTVMVNFTWKHTTAADVPFLVTRDGTELRRIRPSSPDAGGFNHADCVVFVDESAGTGVAREYELKTAGGGGTTTIEGDSPNTSTIELRAAP